MPNPVLSILSKASAPKVAPPQMRQYQGAGPLYGDTLIAKINQINASSDATLANAQLYRSKASEAHLGASTKTLGSSFYDKVGKLESQGRYDAYNKVTGATGKYQFIRKWQEPLVNKLGYTWDQFKSDPKVQELAMHELTRQNRMQLEKLGLPTDAKTLYMAHQQGIGGVKALYGKGTLSAAAIRNNLPASVPATLENFKSYWSTKLSNLFN